MPRLWLISKHLKSRRNHENPGAEADEGGIGIFEKGRPNRSAIAIGTRICEQRPGNRREKPTHAPFVMVGSARFRRWTVSRRQGPKPSARRSGAPAVIPLHRDRDGGKDSGHEAALYRRPATGPRAAPLKRIRKAWVRRQPKITETRLRAAALRHLVVAGERRAHFLTRVDDAEDDLDRVICG